MKEKIFDKILSKGKKFDLVVKENKKLKDINLKLAKEMYRGKDNNRILKMENINLQNKNEVLSNKNNNLSRMLNQTKNENKRILKLNAFINFQEFLSNSYVSPVVKAPFSAQDKRVFAFMDHISKYLIQSTLKLKEKPLVTIIMSTFNKNEVIQDAINSVLNQSYGNWELFIIDLGSDDNTLESLKDISNEKINVFSFSKNKCLASARNEALKNASGEYIMYLNSDNEWDSKYVESMIGAFSMLHDADAIYSGQLIYNNRNSKPHAIRFCSLNKSLLHNRNYIDINSFAHKKSILNDVGGFDEGLDQLIDWDFILRINDRFKMYSVPIILTKCYNCVNFDNISDYPSDYYSIASKILNKNKISYGSDLNISRKVSIIIPSYESLDELKKCVESIRLNDLIEIIIVDNNSNIEVREYLNSIESNQIKIILNDVNYGFTYAVEQAIRISDKSADILLLNNDAILTPGVIENLQNGAYSYKDCGVIVPHEWVFEGNEHMNYHVPYADPKFKCDVTPSKIHHNIINIPVFHDGELLELNFAPFFCTYIKREVYNRTLGFDSELGRHYRSDRIFSDFVRHILGLKIYQEPKAHVFHKHKSSTNKLRENKKDFDYMFRKNQWPSGLAKKLGYKNALWD